MKHKNSIKDAIEEDIDSRDEHSMRTITSFLNPAVDILERHGTVITSFTGCGYLTDRFMFGFFDLGLLIFTN